MQQQIHIMSLVKPKKDPNRFTRENLRGSYWIFSICLRVEKVEKSFANPKNSERKKSKLNTNLFTSRFFGRSPLESSDVKMTKFHKSFGSIIFTLLVVKRSAKFIRSLLFYLL